MDNKTTNEYLEQVKELPLTRNEALYLSDSVTLLMEIEPEAGKIQIPARNLYPQANVSVSVDLIQTIGMAVLMATKPSEIEQEVIMKVAVADLFLLRECCQSYIKVNREYVGFNLLRKIYALILEDNIKERDFIEDLTKDVDTSLIPRTDTLKEIKERHARYLKDRDNNG